MTEEANNTTQSQEATEPHGEAQQTDWEAKYREAVSHSRKWEQRAKDNSAAAAELEKLKESSLSEAEKTGKGKRHKSECRLIEGRVTTTTGNRPWPNSPPRIPNAWNSDFE